MAAFYDAFISYARADSKAFAIALKEQLKVRGLSQIWLDLDDIPSATDWQGRIDDAIERSHHVIYIISPSAMASPYCKLELERAIAYGKRIIPLLHVGGGDSAAWATHDPTGCATIRLLNWIWCRDGVDDPAQYLDKLSRTLHVCDEKTGAEQPEVKAYLHQHTTLLTQALGWDRRHRETRFLLVGRDRQAAETWLRTRTIERAPLPCTPTDLHCEFITESIKNASNLMTQAFLCHSDQDQAAADQLRRSLLRQGITVWNYRTDIQTSQDYTSAIGQGIEEADNVVFVLSPHSAQSPYCQQELAQAIALNKRVIPVLAAPVEPELVPEGLRTIQHIDLTDNTQASDYAADESQLFRQLNTDAAYHTEHKTWLVQALKWQRQQQNPTLLLRGYNLRRAESWLKVARTHRHLPTALHEQFIAESLRQPPNPALDVFISYSRVDSDFARRLNDALQTQGKRTWFDQESIATGTDFQQEIYRGIESSDVFVFVLSPESVNSPFCADEVEYAQGLNKRMVTVLHRAIDVADLHPVLAKLQWLDFREHDGDFQANFAGLLRTLDTDREHLETHTRLLVRSGEWDRRGRDESLLLRGQDLQTAETWLISNAAVEPQPTGLQQEYIRAGRARQEAEAAAEKKLRRGRRLGVLAAVAGIVVAAGAGWLARTEQQKAIASIEEADARIAQADMQVAEANTKRDKANQQTETARQETQQAKRDQQEAQNAATAAAQAQQTAETRAREADGKAQTAAVAQQQAEASAQAADAKAQAADTKAQAAEVRAKDADIRTANARRDQRLAQIGTRLEQAGTFALSRFEFNQIEALLKALKAGSELQTAVAEAGIPVKAISRYPAASPIFALQQLQVNLPRGLLAHQDFIFSASFSATGDAVVTASANSTARVWDLKTGQSVLLEGYIDVVEGHTFFVRSALFNATGDQVVTASDDGTAQVWDLKTGESTLLEGHIDSVTSAIFNAMGDVVVTASRDGTARVWDLKSGQSTPLEGHTDSVTSASFNRTGEAVVTSSEDGTARVWDLQTGESTLLEGHTGSITSASFNATGDAVVTASRDSTARVWDLKTGELTLLEGHTGAVTSASFNATEDAVVTSSEDGTARVWDLKTGKSRPLEGHTGSVNSARFNAMGDQVVTASEDDTARVWDLKTGESTPLEGHTGIVRSASFDAMGDTVVTASRDGTARVWDLKTGESTPGACQVCKEG
ncbi:TIR domain-containing protein [Nodosilinea sp. LEGE 07298]|uniref:toll/interleukin-1 receptor domain-containing protein n=1 Tax=Nodosilinea sp. LEGE 07298 TaxID=2777970 RepID=UPI00187EF7BC|nr:TIR domain-containing protein [Nodosilinea sp. LEGE 07298]MBE9111409.1 TIR domain-containing protein [Nodosilinea sp. LEGE 07298]